MVKIFIKSLALVLFILIAIPIIINASKPVDNRNNVNKINIVDNRSNEVERKNQNPTITVNDSADTILQNAFRNQQSQLQVQGEGVVTKILSDDLDGSRHQRFILRLNTGQTLLVAHNIDLAPRILGLNTGDVVGFYGVYEWNSKGGVIHWTHHDPGGRHIGGWLMHDGKVYQ